LNSVPHQGQAFNGAGALPLPALMENIPSNLPSTPALQGLSEAQERAMRLIRQNVNASFAWADELAKATELEEIYLDSLRIRKKVLAMVGERDLSTRHDSLRVSERC
jgi:hypothetical protein